MSPTVSYKPDEHELAILQVIGVMGAATRTQLNTYFSRSGHIMPISEVSSDAWSQASIRWWIDQILDHRLALKLPSPGQYYSGQTALRMVPLELTEEGRKALKGAGIEVPRRTFAKGSEVDKAALQHALATLDIRLALLDQPDIASVDTDLPLGGVRPDNLAKWTDENKLWTLFESELEAERGSETRIRKKLERLANFYLSGDGKQCDPAVRIIYLWKPLDDKDLEKTSRARHRHEIATDVWSNACYAVRVQMPGRTLPFNLYFISHRDFLAQPDAPLESYEYLPSTGADLPPLPGTGSSLDEMAGEQSGPDYEALAWILGFNRETRRGTVTMQEHATHIKMFSNFLDSRSALRISLQRLISVFTNANGSNAARRLEQIGVALLANLGIPSLPPGITEEEESRFPVTPTGLVTPGEMPKLRFVIAPSFAQEVLKACPPGTKPDELAKALSWFVRFAVQLRWELDLVGKKKKR